MHIYAKLQVVLFTQTVFKDSETELIVSPLQRLCSFYLMWQFLVKLAEYTSPSIRNALSHLGLCVVSVKMMANEACGHFVLRNDANLWIVIVVTQPTFTRFPTWTVEKSWQFVADSFVGFGFLPQIQVVMQLKEEKNTTKLDINK